MRRLQKLIIPTLFIIITIIVIHANANTPTNDYDGSFKRSSSTLLDSNLFTQSDDLRPYEQGQVDMSGFTKTLENDKLELHINPDTFAFRVVNKQTGFVWSSDLLEYDQESLPKPWITQIHSPFYYNYYDHRNRPLSASMLDSKPEMDYTVDRDSQCVRFHVDLTETDIRLSYSLTLKDNDLKFHLDHDSIEEYGTYKISSIRFFEFLGAAEKDTIPGYNFIPSGNGALVRYGAMSQINTIYSARFYGQDLYYPTTEDHLMLNYPVYGSVHGINQNGFLVTITGGAEFATYNYAPAGYQSNYHRQFTRFHLRESYIQPIKGSDKSPLIIEKEIKPYDISFTISFLSNEDANYVGMAKEYKEYLVESNFLEDIITDREAIEVHLDIFGSDYEQGIFFKERHLMTTTDQILTIHNELQKNNVSNIFYTLRGFNKGGALDASYTNYQFDKKLGNLNDLKGLDYAYYYNPTVRYRLKSKAPKHSLKRIDNFFAQAELMSGEYYKYYVDILEIEKNFDRAYKDIQKYGGMALDGLSNLFYSNNKRGREEMYEVYYSLLNEPIPMYNPNQVMLPFTEKFLTVPFQHDRLRFFTDNVPFLQIVLSGKVPYYSPYLNFSANLRIDALKAIDFGAYPAYLITYEPSHLLSNTLSREFYASYFENTKQYIIEHYHFINDALKHVIGEEIIDRQVIGDGIVVVTYSNGVEIVVNYSNNDYVYDGNTVKAQNYWVGSRENR